MPLIKVNTNPQPRKRARRKKQTRTTAQGTVNINVNGKSPAQRVRGTPGAPVTQALNRRGIVKPSRAVKLSGSSRVWSGQVKAQDGGVILSMDINPSTLDTLAVQAADFQHYRFTRVSANIITDASSSVSGMLAAAFVRDAADEIPIGNAGLAVLDAQPGMRQFKVWQASTRVTTNPTKWLYTSPSTDARLSTQLKLVIMAIGNFSQEITVNVVLDYTVELKERTMTPPTEIVTVPTIRPGYVVGTEKGVKGLVAWPADSTTAPYVKDPRQWLEFDFPAITGATNPTPVFRYLASTSITVRNTEGSGGDLQVYFLNFREVYLIASPDGTWTAYPAELSRPPDYHAQDYRVRWLTEFDTFTPVIDQGNAIPATTLANSFASLKINGPRSRGYIPTWDLVLKNSDLYRAYSKVGLTELKTDSESSMRDATTSTDL